MKYNFYPFNGKGKFELVLQKDNKAVIKADSLSNYRAPYNGYVVFKAKDIPEDWWGNYSAGALQYLDIHGGITFCECYVGDENIFKHTMKILKKKISAIVEKDYMKKFKKQQEYRRESNMELANMKDSYVVFGFDCAHSGDENDRQLFDLEYVMKLTEKMERQLIDYAKIYKKWKEANREDKIKIIEKIVGEVDTDNMGMGGLIDMLSGGKSFD